ncbi:hypothetical protein HYH03_013759 [Edaphochlamys debaryana]|uniref:AB hydrolase-1 domain-containing protein n=1 Tax=Edaphochlamys debaryana TaxID=47281 RepID=A0A835XQ65_9CHLO|nr:hypothetical protein HYH03_013759 [Edaphochlamys debaryana]|eukprot:KAG2487620.1 hypothetical protein HYH03_013759 [Edaphochlamys debaryana]
MHTISAPVGGSASPVQRTPWHQRGPPQHLSESWPVPRPALASRALASRGGGAIGRPSLAAASSARHPPVTPTTSPTTSSSTPSASTPGPTAGPTAAAPARRPLSSPAPGPRPASATASAPATASTTAAQPPPPNRPNRSDRASGAELSSSLVSALAAQFRKEALPGITDLVAPLLMGPPPPLTDTVAPDQLADPDSRFVTVRGVRLHYKVREPPGAGDRGFGSGFGSGSAAASSSSEGAVAIADPPPTLLLMHGLNGSTFNWRLVMGGLAAHVSPGTGGCRVIAYDRPPYGLSARPVVRQGETEAEDNPYTLRGGAELALGLLDALLPPSSASFSSSISRSSCDPFTSSSSSPPRAVLVGHSAGASVAVEAAMRHPEQVAGLVLVCPAVSTEERGFLARADLGQLLRFAWVRALLGADGPGTQYIRRQIRRRRAEVEAGRLGVYADESNLPREVIEGNLLPLRARDWDVGALQSFRNIDVASPPPPLSSLSCPVLILHGAADRVVPVSAGEAVAAALRKRGPGLVTELVVLDGCGHLPMDERPSETLAAVVDFVNRHCCQPPPPPPPAS